MPLFVADLWCDVCCLLFVVCVFVFMYNARKHNTVRHKLCRKGTHSPGCTTFLRPGPRSWIGMQTVDTDLIYQDTTAGLQWIEQLQDGTLRRPQPLPVPKTGDYVAADFDGDGDIDLVFTIPSRAGWKYYERREDGSLDEVHDNPFDDSLWRTVSPSTSSMNPDTAPYSALGDWNGDGAPGPSCFG